MLERAELIIWTPAHDKGLKKMGPTIDSFIAPGLPPCNYLPKKLKNIECQYL